MNIRIRQVLFLASLILCQACYGNQFGDPTTPDLPNTVTKDNRLLFLSKDNKRSTFLVGYDLSIPNRAIAIGLPFAKEMIMDREYPGRWCYDYGHIWLIEFSHERNFQGTFVSASLHRFPWSCFENDPWRKMRQTDDIELRELVISDPYYRVSMDLLPIINAQMDYNKKILIEHGGSYPSGQHPVPAKFAFVPTSKETVRLFLLNENIMRIMSEDFSRENGVGGHGDWLDEGTVPVVFDEPFQVYSKDTTNYFFVTESGSVFVWKYGSKDAPVKIWDADKAPVKTIIQDADNDKVYAFARGQYFELAEKLEPKEYSRSLAQLIGMAPSKNQLIDMARIIRADQAAAKKK